MSDFTIRLGCLPSNLQSIWETSDHGYPSEVLSFLALLDTIHQKNGVILPTGFKQTHRGKYTYDLRPNKKHPGGYVLYLSFKSKEKRTGWINKPCTAPRCVGEISERSMENRKYDQERYPSKTKFPMDHCGYHACVEIDGKPYCQPHAKDVLFDREFGK